MSTPGQYGIWWRHLPQLATPLDKYLPLYKAMGIYHNEYFHKVYFMHIFASIMYQTSIYCSGFFTHMHRCTYTHLWHFAKNAFFSKKCLSCDSPILCLLTECPMSASSHPARWQWQCHRRVRFCLVPCVQQWPNTTQGTQIMKGLLSLPQRTFTMA